MAKATVYLVGAGPGDPGLITVKGRQCIEDAQVVIYDYLASPELLKHARKNAELIYVGKKGGDHTLSQDEINALIVKKAAAGLKVCRLKGGDPFIFGRGGEEIDTLSAEGVPFQVVPGITAASGCACFAGIPLTHRDYAQSCVFVTGHLKDGSMNLNWDALVQPRQTIAIYMGIHGLDVLCRELVMHGMSESAPAALIEHGTLPDQRVLIGNLLTLPDIVKSQEIKPPSMVIVGDVVKLHEKLAWFEPA